MDRRVADDGARSTQRVRDSFCVLFAGAVLVVHLSFDGIMNCDNLQGFVVGGTGFGHGRFITRKCFQK